MRKPKEIFRIIFSIKFLIGSITNFLILIFKPGLYTTFADLSLLEAYRTAWADVVLPNLNVMILIVAAFEFALAILIASKEGAVQTGLVLAMAFMLFLIPFWWAGGALINIIFAVLLAWLARYDYPESFTHMLIRGGPK